MESRLELGLFAETILTLGLEFLMDQTSLWWIRITTTQKFLKISSKNLRYNWMLRIFACRSKAKAKPQRRGVAGSSSGIIPMNRRTWIDIEPGKHSLSLRTKFRRKWFIFFVILSKHIEKTERFISGEVKKIFRIHSHNLLIGLTIDGKHVKQQEVEQKGDISTALMIQE